MTVYRVEVDVALDRPPRHRHAPRPARPHRHTGTAPRRLDRKDEGMRRNRRHRHEWRVYSTIICGWTIFQCRTCGERDV